MSDNITSDDAYTRRLLFESHPPSSPFSEEWHDEIFTMASGEIGFVRPVYKFKKGLCLIFNHEHFDVNLELSSRDGTEVDKNAIEEYFREIGLIVPDAFQDKKKVEIREILHKYANDKDKPEYDFLVCFVLTHGHRDLLCAKDDVYPMRILYEPFLPDNCEFLKGKPKLFILNACQGGSFDKGIEFDACDLPIDTPEDDDFLVAMSSVPGFKSLRHPDTGSFYIQSLIRTLRNSRNENDNKDIHSILTTVHREIAANVEFSSEQVRMSPENRIKFPRIKQMPIYFSTLRDELALTSCSHL